MKYFYENRKYIKELPAIAFSDKSLSFHAHWHEDIEIAYILSGNITVGINNEKYFLSQDDIIFLNSGDIHFYDSKNSNSEMLLLIFKQEILFGLSSPFKNNFFNSQVIKANSNLVQTSKIKSLLTDICNENTVKEVSYQMFIQARICEIFGILSRYLINYDKKTNNNRQTFQCGEIMKDILLFIEENYMNEISLTQISKKFCISSFQLCRLFKEVTGNNFKTYLNTMRASYAENLLISGNHTVTEVAFECGINNIRTFNRVYKQIKGTTPNQTKKLYADVKPS